EVAGAAAAAEPKESMRAATRAASTPVSARRFRAMVGLLPSSIAPTCRRTGVTRAARDTRGNSDNRPNGPSRGIRPPDEWCRSDGSGARLGDADMSVVAGRGRARDPELARPAAAGPFGLFTRSDARGGARGRVRVHRIGAGRNGDLDLVALLDAR